MRVIVPAPDEPAADINKLPEVELIALPFISRGRKKLLSPSAPLIRMNSVESPFSVAIKLIEPSSFPTPTFLVTTSILANSLFVEVVSFALKYKSPILSLLPAILPFL